MHRSDRSLPAAPRRLLRALAIAAAATPVMPSRAQEAPAAPTSLLLPSLAVEESYFDTRGRTSGENGHELVSRVTPGLRYTSRSGRLQGSLDYAADLLYRRGRSETEGGEVQNQLNAAFVAEAVPNWAFIDARASISQQSISAFGEQTVGGSPQFNDNRTEVSTLSLSPYVRGGLGNLADYEVRLSAGASDSGTASAPDSNSSSASMVLRSRASGAIFGWSLSASKERVKFSNADPVDNGRVQATVSVTPAPEVRLSLNGGRESVEDGSAASNHTNTAGAALLWTPSPRTSLSADITERYFGRSKHLAFSHRGQRTVWSYALSRDTTGGADGIAFAGAMTELQLRMLRLASAYPNPIEREQAALDEINALGLDPNRLVALGFLTSSFSIQRRQDFSFAWTGQRLSFGLQAYTTALSQLTSIATDDPVAGEATVEHGYSSTLSYRLTPFTSASLGGSRRMVFDTSLARGTDLKSINVGLTSQLGRRTTGQLGARYTVFNSSTDPYRETSLSGSISLRF